MTNAGTREERRRLAAAYATSVQALISPMPERGTAGQRRPAPRPARLLSQSQALKAAAQAALTTSQDSLEKAAAEVQLLAGATLDLVVAGQLAAAQSAGVRGLATPSVDVNELRALIEAPEAYLSGAVVGRALRAPQEAKQAVAIAASTALENITGDVVTVGGRLIGDLLALDAACLKEALQIVGAQIADRIGFDLKGARRRVIDFIIAANEKIIALLGADALAEVQRLLAMWLGELQAGTLFPALIERLYETDAIVAEIKWWLVGYQGSEAALLMARDEIVLLAGRFAARAGLVARITAALALVKLLPALAAPHGRVAVAAVYLGLLAYIVGSGYDHADSDRLRVLDWVEGVRGVARRLLIELAAA